MFIVFFQLDSLSREDLIKFVKRQMMLVSKSKSQNESQAKQLEELQSQLKKSEMVNCNNERLISLKNILSFEFVMKCNSTNYIHMLIWLHFYKTNSATEQP